MSTALFHEKVYSRGYMLIQLRNVKAWIWVHSSSRPEISSISHDYCLYIFFYRIRANNHSKFELLLLSKDIGYSKVNYIYQLTKEIRTVFYQLRSGFGLSGFLNANTKLWIFLPKRSIFPTCHDTKFFGAVALEFDVN